MKFNRLISSALVFVVLFTSLFALIPVNAFAAESGPIISVMPEDKVITEPDKVNAICKEYLKYDFDTAAEMLAHELELGYLDYVIDGDYAVYVNRYTGFVYYVNNVTGQILTSNPIDPYYQGTKSLQNAVMSQIELEFFELSNTSTVKNYDSLNWIMDGSLPRVFANENGGIGVEYILGSALDAFIAPSVILLETANELIIHPMFAKLTEILLEKCGEFDSAYAKSGLTSYNVLEHDIYRDDGVSYDNIKLRKVLSALDSYALTYFGNKSGNSDYQQVKTIIGYISTDIFSNYSIINPDTTNIVLQESIAVLSEGKSVLLLSGAHLGETSLSTVRKVDKAIKTLCPDYTIDLVQVHEDACGFVSTTPAVPCFKVTVNYKLENGELVVDVPANSITFDETIYAIGSISILKYFGAGNMDNDGYAFYPDGSGSIINFKDFYYGSTSDKINNSVYMDNKVYGVDYCYSNITGAHREQITMPVYGMVNDVAANELGLSAAYETVTNGFFAIIEEGASLATIGYSSGGGVHKYMNSFATYIPKPNDTYDLSQSISVSGLGSYTVVAPASYEGSLKTRYVMLADENLIGMATLSNEAFASDYVGMAECYRSYLEDSGVIELIESNYSSLPLYIEALGSMDIVKKVMSFPVTTSIPLTSFEDIATMYSELSNAKNTILAKAQENAAAADALEVEDAEKHAAEIERHRRLANEYEALAEKIVDIKNVNFRLTGFANGGMHFTYPAKVKWQKSVGGKKGFSQLLDTAKSNTNSTQTFGVYPDFDFMYINNTSSFDGIGRKGTAACMVDNRYASKQTYNSVNQKFETLFALLVSSNALDGLYTKFDKQYSKYGATGLSVSSLGSDLNSNFDEDNPVVREQSLNDIKALLAKMSGSYSLMSDMGNSYVMGYVDHVLNAPTDSSHFNNSSYAVPFFGMVYHGYINYTGSPLNYSGSSDYEILRSIESGAALYYILCTQNTNYLKGDIDLAKYYGIDYNNWFDKMVEQYSVINSAIGDLQSYKIVDHELIRSERIIDEDEMNANYHNLIDEFLIAIDDVISDKIDDKVKEMRDNGMIGAGLKFYVSDAELLLILKNASERTNLTIEELNSDFALSDKIKAVFAKYESAYASGSESVTLLSSDITYKTKYAYVTDSFANSDNYVYTDFTCDNGNVVMVTYEKVVDGEKRQVVFLLNYNVFSVEIKIDASVHKNFANYVDENGCLVLDSYGFVKIQ